MSSLLSIRTITRAVVIALSAMLVVSMPVFAQNATSSKLPNIRLPVTTSSLLNSH